MHGVIKKLAQDKGYGFISQGAGTKDVFFHISGMVNGGDFASLKEGDKVVYGGVEVGNNGKEHAVDVELDLD